MALTKAQKIFNTVAKHLLTQRKKSYGAMPPEVSGIGRGCLYRGPNGLKCAAGVLIPDKYYKRSMEGSNIRGVPYFRARYEGNLALLETLQDIHDCDRASGWKRRLTEVADHEGLSPSVLEDF